VACLAIGKRCYYDRNGIANSPATPSWNRATMCDADLR